MLTNGIDIQINVCWEESNAMFQHILVPLDGSPGAERALPIAAQLARSSKGTLVLLRVVPSPVEFNSYPADADFYADSCATMVEEKELEFDRKAAKDYLIHMTASDDLEGVGVQTEVIVGTPARGILSLTQRPPIDLIVMCSHDYTGFKHWMLGSIAQKVARHSSVPVLVLHAGEALSEARRGKNSCSCSGAAGWLSVRLRS